MKSIHAPLLPLAACLMAGIVAARWWMPTFPFVFVFTASVLLAFACRRWPVAQSIVIGICFMTLGMTLAQWQCEEQIEGQTVEAVVMSEPAERPKTVGVDLLVPKAGKTVRCYLQKDERSISLRLGDMVVVSLSDRQKNESDSHRPSAYFVKGGNWQPGGTALQQMSSVQRTRLFFLHLRHRLLARYQALNAEDEVYGVLAAMTLGDKSALTPDVRDAYNDTGVGHVLALSGLHVGMIYMLLTLLTLRRPRFWLSQVLIVSAIWAFALVTGLSPSVTRSATMISIYAIFAVRNQGRTSLNVLAFAAIVMLVADVQVLFEVGFQLSFLSVFSILLFVPLFDSLYNPRQLVCGKAWKLHLLLRWLWGMFTVSLAAQLGVTPLIAFYFGRLSTWFLLANFIVIPAATVIVYGALLTLVFPPVGQLLVWVVRLLNHVLSAIADLPFSCIDNLHPTALQTVLIYILIALFYLFARRLFPIITGRR